MRDVVLLILGLIAVTTPTEAQDAASIRAVKQALARYDAAFRTKDLATIRSLLSEDVLLYEHSVRNDGRKEVFEKHLKPEILEFEDMEIEFSDVRITASDDLALVTRSYVLRGKYEGRTIDARGNETMAWKKTDGDWRIVHIHYSHPCPPRNEPGPAEANDGGR